MKQFIFLPRPITTFVTSGLSLDKYAITGEPWMCPQRPGSCRKAPGWSLARTVMRDRLPVEGKRAGASERRTGRGRHRASRVVGESAPEVDVNLSSNERLQKVLARVGIASRRAAEALIAEGRVSVNGKQTTKLGTAVNIWRDNIFVNGIPVRVPTSAIWLAMYKPRGFLSFIEGKGSLSRFFDSRYKELVPAGAIEEDASGLIILTNERGSVPILSRPDNPHVQIWYVDCLGVVTNQQLNTLNKGVMLDGPQGRPVHATVILVDVGKGHVSSKERARMCRLEFRLRDSRRHVVRRLCESVDLTVVRLIRRSFGPVLLGDLRPGMYRKLKTKEIKALKRGVSARTLSKSKS